MKTIKIAEDFSSAPAGRFPEDGPFNGTTFREELLVPALSESDIVVIVLDGVSGFGSSFLEEAFGGLVRLHGYDRDDLKRRIEVKFEDPALVFYADSIVDFINEAEVE
ncbi:STAS-like domain-containing protein [Lysobacter sp. F6437]|uniref:STAS-like domain-containing protein n=1 Tax=Lysobacter sp. F6437 TaxID=3459296 RepID=UPI00403D63BC